jgi:cytochrome c peroxidase
MSIRLSLRSLVVAAAVASTPSLAQQAPAQSSTSTLRSRVIGLELPVAFGQLPARYEDPKNPITPAKVELGRMLYFDARLSKNQDVSCNSCHDLARYGVDGLPVSPGHRKQVGNRNSPTVYNAAGHSVQFWDGRAPNVEEQAKGPILNPVEMAMPNAQAVVSLLKTIPGYVTAFQKAFPGEADPVTYDNLGLAIGAFERQLVTPSRFDKYQAGNTEALNAQEQRGMQRFAEVGCTLCHNGPAVGGTMMSRLGWLVEYPRQKDQGLFEQTKRDDHRMIFRVPTLRNIAKTGPYFHDGSVQDLPTAVRLMGWHQLAKKLTDEEVNDIVAFLQALTGELPGSYISRPALPPSGPNTPKPDPT